MACAACFLSAGAMLVSAHDGGVNHHVFVVVIAARQNVIDRIPLVVAQCISSHRSAPPQAGHSQSQIFADSEIPRASGRRRLASQKSLIVRAT